MKLLVAAAKIDFHKLPEIAARIRGLGLDPALEVVLPDAVPWSRLVEVEGSFDGAYAWAARSFDACLVVETEFGTLGRGTFQIAQEFLRRGKRVVVLRDGGLLAVRDVAPTGVDDWKANYGAVLLD